MAIVNEDPSMVKFLLDSGANFHERCVGNFMCPEDQKATRTDSLDHEWVNLSPETNYEGYELRLFTYLLTVKLKAEVESFKRPKVTL